MCIRDRLWVIGRGSLATLLTVRLVPGDLFMLAAVVGWAFYSWLLVQPPAHMRGNERPTAEAVSYTHLDVYKRQIKKRRSR